MNVMQHANVISIGDCSKKEAQQYFEEVLAPHVPDKLKNKIRFEELYSVFGGKLAHLADYSEFGELRSSTEPSLTFSSLTQQQASSSTPTATSIVRLLFR